MSYRRIAIDFSWKSCLKKLTAKNLTTRLALLVVANATSSISLPAANFANPKVDGLIHRQWRRRGWPRRRCWLNRVDINHHSWSWYRRRRKWRWSVSRRVSRSVSPSPGRRGCVRPGASHRHCARRWHRCARGIWRSGFGSRHAASGHWRCRRRWPCQERPKARQGV